MSAEDAISDLPEWVLRSVGMAFMAWARAHGVYLKFYPCKCPYYHVKKHGHLRSSREPDRSHWASRWGGTDFELYVSDDGVPMDSP